MKVSSRADKTRLKRFLMTDSSIDQSSEEAPRLLLSGRPHRALNLIKTTTECCKFCAPSSPPSPNGKDALEFYAFDNGYLILIKLSFLRFIFLFSLALRNENFFTAFPSFGTRAERARKRHKRRNSSALFPPFA
jgi:hypothetical protein